MVPAVVRAVAILRLLGRTDEPLGVNKIARRLDLIPSTALHILRTLMAEGLVKFDENTKLYDLDTGLVSIAHRVLQNNRFLQDLQATLHQLAEHLGMTMLAVKTAGLDEMTVVALATTSSPIRLHADVGSRFPSLISATGRLVAALGGYNKSDLKKRFDKLKWDKPMSFGDWWNQVQLTKKDRYAIDDGAFMAGVAVVSVPVFENGKMTYSIVAMGLRDQMADLGIENVATELRAAASRLSPGGE